MPQYLIDLQAQRQISEQIQLAVRATLMEFLNHGSEEGLTPVLGSKLMGQKVTLPDLDVRFSYRQHHKSMEEPHSGADGGLLVKVTNTTQRIKKAALFQAKLLKGYGPVRRLRMNTADATRLRGQCKDMLLHSDEAVALFYTYRDIYIVDAAKYVGIPDAPLNPLAEPSRLVTLSTYLGKWIPRCTRGDRDEDLVTRIEHDGGFEHGLTMTVVSNRPAIRWSDDPDEIRWRGKR